MGFSQLTAWVWCLSCTETLESEETDVFIELELGCSGPVNSGNFDVLCPEWDRQHLALDLGDPWQPSCTIDVLVSFS